MAQAKADRKAAGKKAASTRQVRDARNSAGQAKSAATGGAKSLLSAAKAVGEAAKGVGKAAASRADAGRTGKKKKR